MKHQFNRRDSLKSIAALGAAGTLGGWSALANALQPPSVPAAPRAAMDLREPRRLIWLMDGLR